MKVIPNFRNYEVQEQRLLEIKTFISNVATIILDRAGHSIEKSLFPIFILIPGKNLQNLYFVILYGFKWHV